MLGRITQPKITLGTQVMELTASSMARCATTAVIVIHDERATRFADGTARITDCRLDAGV